ncbi:hypothetical protein EJB05_13968 [Eragrostis curvula]|uniref:Uncharacterized protein n=1 Tax=Eragrostis curvula TaxID=38414 RepID=A0A5J9VXZ0_9POAL|nr:hypothetical protein EJB05_13968 [Eragrostis curvula]
MWTRRGAGRRPRDAVDAAVEVLALPSRSAEVVIVPCHRRVVVDAAVGVPMLPLSPRVPASQRPTSPSSRVPGLPRPDPSIYCSAFSILSHKQVVHIDVGWVGRSNGSGVLFIGNDWTHTLLRPDIVSMEFSADCL